MYSTPDATVKTTANATKIWSTGQLNNSNG